MILAYPSTIITNGLGEKVTKDYQSRIVAAGGTLSTAQYNAHVKFVDKLNIAGVWSRLLELWTCSGSNLAASFVKLLYPSAIASSMTNVGFVAADYTPTGGLQGGNGKYLKTGFIPSARLSSYQDASLSTYVKSFVKTGSANAISYVGAQASGFRLFTSVSSNTFAANFSDLYSKAGATVNSLICVSTISESEGFLSLNSDTNFVNLSSVTNAALPSTEITIYTSGASTSLINQGKQYTYHVGKGLTKTQAQILSAATAQLNSDLGR